MLKRNGSLMGTTFMRQEKKTGNIGNILSDASHRSKTNPRTSAQKQSSQTSAVPQSLREGRS